MPTVFGLRPPGLAVGSMMKSSGWKMLVASGEGYYIGVASPFTQSHRVSGVAVVPLDDPDARLEVHIAWKKSDTSRAMREFVRSAPAAFPPSAEATRSGAA